MICYNNKNCSFQNFLNNNPSLPVLIGLLSSLIPCIYFPYLQVYLLFAISLILILILNVFLNKKRLVLKIIIWSITGFAVYFINDSNLSNNYSSFFPRGNCGAQIKAVLVDPGIIGNDLPWLPNPKYLKVEVQAIRFSDNDKWRNTYGKANAYFPRETKSFKYGELLELKGCFIKPEEAIVPGGFDYSSYLRTDGINRMFICSDYKQLGVKGFPYSLFRKIFIARNKALGLLCDGIKSQSIRTFLAGFFFGCRQGLDSKIKQNFLRSGTIHILAISGLHAGVLALIFLLILRPLPITFRYLIIPVLLSCYLCFTGFRPSGVRALFMISILCFHRGFFYSFSPVNSIAFAAVIIILINPFAIDNIGFQFSFIIAGLLILSWEKVNDFLFFVSEKNRWNVQNNFSWYIGLKRYLFRKITLLIVTCIIAGVACTGLTLYYQNLFIPLMFLTNILVLPLLFPLFLIGFFKIFVALCLGSFSFILNYLLNDIVYFILFVAKCGASSNYSIFFKKPSILVLVLFYICLLFFLVTIRSNRRIISFFGLIAILCFWFYNHVFSEGFVAVMQEKGNTPAVIIIKPDSYISPIIVNCPENLKFMVLEKLKMEGVNCIECLVITGSSRKLSGGVTFLIEKIPVKKVLITEHIFKNKAYKEIIEMCKKNSVQISFIQSLDSKETYSKSFSNNIKLDISNIGIKIQATYINPGNKQIEIEINNSKKEIFNLKNSNLNQFYEVRI